MGFIPDRGVSKTKTVNDNPISTSPVREEGDNNKSAEPKEKTKAEKKVVSYYLELDLIDKVKSLADRKEIYYSSLVSTALREWISKRF